MDDDYGDGDDYDYDDEGTGDDDDYDDDYDDENENDDDYDDEEEKDDNGGDDHPRKNVLITISIIGNYNHDDHHSDLQAVRCCSRHC